MDGFEENTKLKFLKDKFIKLWPDLAYTLIDLDSKYCSGNERTLVIGSGRILRILGKNIINTDIRPFKGVAVVTDCQKLSFGDNHFDIVVCCQVLEHIPDADSAVFEMHRVLKPGGKIVVTVPFYFPFHASPYDFRRWTVLGLRTTFRQFREIESGIYIGPVSAVLSGIQHFFGIIVPNFYISYLIKILIGYILYPLKYLDIFVSKLPNAINMALSVYFVGEK